MALGNMPTCTVCSEMIWSFLHPSPSEKGENKVTTKSLPLCERNK